MKKVKIPREVVKAVGPTLGPKGLRSWWMNRSTSFGNRIPRERWEEGSEGREEVLVFIAKARATPDTT